MPPKKKKNVNQRQMMAAETRKKIKTAAFALFAQHGFDGVTVDQIIKATETSKGAFYNHFKSKDDVVLQQFQETDHMYNEFIEQIDNDKPPFNRILLFMKMATELVEEWGVDMMRVIYSNQIKKSENGSLRVLLNEKRVNYTFLRQVLREGQQKGVFRQDLSAAFMSRILMRTLRSFIYDWCMADGGFNLTMEVQKHNRLLLDIIEHK